MIDTQLTRRGLLTGAFGMAAAAVACAKPLRSLVSAPVNRLPWRAIDASYIPQVESLGVDLYSGKAAIDPIRLAAASGINVVRLQVRVNTTDGFRGTASTLLMAQRVQEAGMRVLIDFYLMDSWADPSQQPIPATWAGLSASALAQRVHDYTRDFIASLDAQGTPAAFVQVGNEVTDGMLWPAGRVTVSGWNAFASLISAGVAGVRDAVPAARQPRILLHIDRSGDNGAARWFFDNALAVGIPFDIIALSYYPWWHGTLATLTANLNDLAARYRRPIWLAEAAYPWTLAPGDSTGNIVAGSSQLHAGYPATPAGQRAFMQALVQTLISIPGGLGQGLCYWGGDAIAVPNQLPSSWENLALFDYSRRVLPALATLGAGAASVQA